MSQLYFENFLVFYFHVLIENGIATVALCRPYLPECNCFTHLHERFQV